MPVESIVLTHLPTDFFNPYLSKVTEIPSFFKISPDEAEYLNKRAEVESSRLILLNAQTRHLMELNDQFNTLRNTSTDPSNEELTNVVRLIIKKARSREATIKEIKKSHFNYISDIIQQFDPNLTRTPLRKKILDLQTQPETLDFHDLNALEDEVINYIRQTIDKEVMGFEGNIMSEKNEAASLPSHPLYKNNTFLLTDSVSKQLKKDLDLLDQQFSSGLTEYKRTKSNASLKDLDTQFKNLNSIYLQYKIKVAEIGKRQKLLTSSDDNSLKDAEKVLFDAINKKLQGFDQMENDIKIHATELKKSNITQQLVGEIKSIIKILKNRDLHFDSSKTSPLITALERRLLYLITPPDSFLERGARMFSPQVSSSSFSKMLTDGWPLRNQDALKKDPKVRQNVISTCHIEAGNLGNMTDNVSDALEIIKNRPVPSSPANVSANNNQTSNVKIPNISDSDSLTSSTESLDSSQSSVSIPNINELQDQLAKYTNFQEQHKKIDLLDYNVNLANFRTIHDNLVKEISKIPNQIDLNDPMVTQGLKNINKLEKEYAQLKNTLDHLVESLPKKYNETVQRIEREFQNSIQKANEKAKAAAGKLGFIADASFNFQIETQEIKSFGSALQRKDLSIKQYEDGLRQIKTSLDNQVNRKINQIIGEIKKPYVNKLKELDKFAKTVLFDEKDKSKVNQEANNYGNAPTFLVDLSRRLNILRKNIEATLTNTDTDINTTKESLGKINEQFEEADLLKEQIIKIQNVLEEPLFQSTNKFLFTIAEELVKLVEADPTLKNPKIKALQAMQESFTSANTKLIQEMQAIYENEPKEETEQKTTRNRLEKEPKQETGQTTTRANLEKDEEDWVDVSQELDEIMLDKEKKEEPKTTRKKPKGGWVDIAKDIDEIERFDNISGWTDSDSDSDSETNSFSADKSKRLKYAKDNYRANIGAAIGHHNQDLKRVDSKDKDYLLNVFSSVDLKEGLLELKKAFNKDENYTSSARPK